MGSSSYYVDVSHVSKVYKLSQGEKRALSDVTLHISEGERVGIIGSNGAGKSTLLSLLSGFASPTNGQVDVQGKVSAILEVGSSIRGEMTGRENLRLGGGLYDLSPKEIEERLPEIINFIDIGDYIDMPMRTYSSGMKARVAFGIVTFISPEILIIDEALGVGDATFAAKSTKRINELCNEGKILLLVSHSMPTINTMTSRCIWLEDGKVRMDGPSGAVTDAYTKWVNGRELDAVNKALAERAQRTSASALAEITSFTATANREAVPASVFSIFDDIRFDIEVGVRETIEQPDIHLYIETIMGHRLMSTRYSQDVGSLAPFPSGKSQHVTLTIPCCKLMPNMYEVTCAISDDELVVAESRRILEMINSTPRKTMASLLYVEGCIHLKHKGEKSELFGIHRN